MCVCVWERGSVCVCLGGCACSLSICGHLQTSCYCLDVYDVLHTHHITTDSRTDTLHPYIQTCTYGQIPIIIPLADSYAHTHAHTNTNPSTHPQPREQLGARKQTVRLKGRILENNSAASQQPHPSDQLSSSHKHHITQSQQYRILHHTIST